MTPELSLLLGAIVGGTGALLPLARLAGEGQAGAAEGQLWRATSLRQQPTTTRHQASATRRPTDRA